MAEDTAPEAAPDDASEGVRGPHFWLNWQAEREGDPARSSTRTSIGLVLPLWEEYGLYSDAYYTGQLEFGPYELMLAFSPQKLVDVGDRDLSVGQTQLALVLRSTDHLGEPSTAPIDEEEADTKVYAGGELDEQLASLLALALSRRARSGGVMRRGYERDAKGTPNYSD